MIKRIHPSHIPECVRLIRESFQTVADAFGFTLQNAPGFTAFATTQERLEKQMFHEKRPMYAFFDNEKIIGYYSLSPLSDQECELNNLCVLPSSRHKGIGQALLEHSFETAGALGYEKMKIGIVEENKVLKAWYISFGFLPIGTKTLVSLPFTCGFLEKPLK